MLVMLAGTSSGRAVRLRIQEAVRKHPGMSKSDLARHLGQSWGSMSHHVRRLAHQGDLRSFRDGRVLRIFPPDVPSGCLRQLAALQHEVAVEVLQLLADADRGIQELVDRVGCSRKVVRKVLQDLDGAGLVERAPGAHGKFHLLEPEWGDLLHRYGTVSPQPPGGG